ncbi:MAG: hypothetical protein IT233_12625 [Bacteroidia bacterium]|nr:hypothetical protein [Bacteroidia bacterium]
MNSYEKDAKRKQTSQWLQNIEDSASDRKLPMGKRLKKGAGQAALRLVTGLAGGFTGAAIGRWSVLGGILATGTGEVIGSPELTSFGVGMMASNLMPSTETVNGPEEEKKSAITKAKDRAKAYGKGILQKFWLDKVIKKKESDSTEKKTETTTKTEEKPMGEVTYYTHPQSETDQMDLSELEKYEEKIKESASDFEKEQEIISQPEMKGTEEIEQIEERLSGTGDDDKFLGSTEEERIL